VALGRTRLHLHYWMHQPEDYTYVVTTSVVVGSIFLAVDDLLRVVELLVSSSTDFVAHRRLKIHVNSTGSVASRRSLTEEGVEGIIGLTNTLVRGHGTVGFNAMLQAIELPALVSGLDTSLSQMNRDTLYKIEERRS
jgi:hypothetical protein